MTNNKTRKHRRTCSNIKCETNNKIGKYRQFTGPIKLIRQSEIRGYAIRYLDHVSKNNGKCKYGFLAGLVREACNNNNALQIYKTDIRNEATRIVAKERKLQQHLSGTTKTSTINNEPLDVDDPQVDDLQLTVRTNIVHNAVANPQPPPLLAGGEVEVNNASVVTTDNYFLFRNGVTVPKTVTHVHFHSSVKYVDSWYYNGFSYFYQHKVFTNCRALVKVVLNNGLENIGENTFGQCSSLHHIIIPSSVTTIGDGAFTNCVSLATIVLNNGLQRIGVSAFNNCTSLRHIIIPPSVTTIDVYAFLGCINLETVVLHEGLQKIGRRAFGGCRSLHNISIPTTATNIGDYAFTGCAVTPHLN
jgi:hypothetical protein